MRPKVTVLMPVLNAAEYLHHAVESILSQSYDDFEFIIIDDCSTDLSWDILKSYNDRRIRIYRNSENIGIARVLNRGLEMALGQYVARMDADDVSLPSRLLRQAEVLDNDARIDLVATNIQYIDSSGCVISPPCLPSSVSPAMTHWLLYWENPIPHPSVMFRARVVKAWGGYSATQEVGEDYELWLRLRHECTMVIIGEVLLYYRQHSEKVTIRQSGEFEDQTILLISKAMEQLIGHCPDLREVVLACRRPDSKPVSRGDFVRAATLLLEMTDAFRRKTAVRGEDVKTVKADVSGRISDILDRRSREGRRASVEALIDLFGLAPGLALSQLSPKLIAKLVLGKSLSSQMGRWARHLRCNFPSNRSAEGTHQ